MINFGVMGEPAFAPGSTRPEAVKADGGGLVTPASGAYKDETMRVMAVGLAGGGAVLCREVLAYQRLVYDPAGLQLRFFSPTPCLPPRECTSSVLILEFVRLRSGGRDHQAEAAQGDRFRINPPGNS